MPESWQLFAAECPALAAQAARLLSDEQGTALLATVTPAETPRICPASPIITQEGVYLLLHRCSDELANLRTQPRCALHSAVCVPGDEELVVEGFAVEVLDRGHRQLVARQGAGLGEWDERKVLLALAPASVTWVMWQSRRRHEVSWQAGAGDQATALRRARSRPREAPVPHHGAAHEPRAGRREPGEPA